MFCNARTLVKENRTEVSAIPMACRAWTCPDCGPKRKAAIARDIIDGKPTALITLTVNPAVGESPEHRQALLADAWRRVRRKARKVWRNGSLAFFAVVEKTAAGEPHLHIAARCEWIGQKWLSDQMQALIGAPVVNIQRVRSARAVARYISKYLSKDPARFGTAKRYWKTQDWKLNAKREARRRRRQEGRWSIFDGPIADWIADKTRHWWVMVAIDPVTFRPPGVPP